ncbi:hypothetical protein COMNV_01378 [Commensalibacter sp. Nvir]|uniref:mitochondrial fission ELM1 family protein n=1 Tax=Commensalibacter sp. Nvir TaxID=3069817 RepID=UPI002D456CD3|nr:hypothetical protein COMNV_01378 [Commensalibacter sp. Nvir]
MPTVNILTEDFAGMKSQAIGLAERAGFAKNFCLLKPKPLWKLISAPYWPFPLKGVEPFCLGNSFINLSVGSVGGVVNAALQTNSTPKIHIQNPRISVTKFDLVIAQPHDHLYGSNVLISRNAIHKISPHVLSENKKKWFLKLKRPDKPIVSVLIGGNNGRFRLAFSEAELICNQLKKLINQEGISLLLTPSRRTNPKIIALFKEKLAPLGAYIWDGNGENPYLGFLACADLILVTIDSVSMISEAIATQAPVMIIPLPGKSKRIFAFIQSLIGLKRIKIFNGDFVSWNVSPLDDTEEIVYQVKKRLNIF